MDGSSWMIGKQTTDTCTSDLFWLRHVDDRKSANMVLKSMIAKVDTPRKKGVEVSIVCTVNHMAIVKYAELVLHIPAKKKRRSFPARAETDKRARLEK